MITKSQLLTILANEVSEDDYRKYDEILQTIRREQIEKLLHQNVSKVWHNDGEVRNIVSILMQTTGTYSAKMNFANKVGTYNFISFDKLFEKNTVKPILDWINDDEDIEYAYNAFVNLSHLTTTSVGAGEIALIIMSPGSVHSGRCALAGDVIVDNKAIELKTRGTAKSHGGRLHDENRARYDWKECKDLFRKVGYDEPYITLSRYIKEIRDTLSTTYKSKIADAVIRANFKFVSNTQTLHDALVHSTIPVIKQEWGVLSFHNYKSYTNFEYMLFLDIHDKYSLFVSDLDQVRTDLKYNSVVLYGIGREAMPQITIKTNVKKAKLARVIKKTTV